ncbi:hypothetical protein BHF71_09385 [Vulcanibacillus modesticaldus]|uniref:CamS family sex pheromone protein n=1 Tax=Vulcanibacillus modesticaldus TaxID=337097 RepID=A0A1D2YU54_9BACI|nr:CamS family sex pheromone protein [Vulcanibacillus modesticaldus]OEF99238.1 hypothetical protein BHF71_09385 [Vulcanibacillus modesticaldus]
MRVNKKLVLVIVSLALILGGCSLRSKTYEEDNQRTDSNSIVSPQVKVNEEYYRGVLPYKHSPVNGMLDEIPSRLDANHFEIGLLEIANKVFEPNDFIFQEGQVLSMDDIELILGSTEYSGFLYTVNEHNYFSEDNQFAGIVLGMVVSPKYYLKDENGEYIRDAYGMRKFAFYTDDELIEKSKRVANDLVSIIRRKGVEPRILVGVMKAETKDMKLPGTFILTGDVKQGENIVWNRLNESFLFLPAKFINLDGIYSDTARAFNHFKDSIDQYFPGFAGITGLARFVDDEMVEMTIKVYAEIDSTVETIQFTQFSVALIEKYFSENIKINLYINSINKPKAIYVKNANGDDFMHVYRY